MLDAATIWVECSSNVRPCVLGPVVDTLPQSQRTSLFHRSCTDGGPVPVAVLTGAGLVLVGSTCGTRGSFLLLLGGVEAPKVAMEQGATAPKADWGSLASLLLEHVSEMMRRNDVDLLPVIKSARLVNRHWCRWASELVTAICSSQVSPERIAVKSPSSFTRVQKLWFREGERPSVADLILAPQWVQAPALQECCDAQHALACLQGLSHLTHLEFSRILFMDSDFEHLARLSDLRRLDLPHCRWISDAGLEQIAKLTSLTHLEIGSCKKSITDDGLRWLAHLTCLEQLRLQNLLGITEAGMVHLTTLTCLKRLAVLGMANVARDSVLQVGALTGIEELEVAQCNGLHLQGLHQITGLEKLTIEMNTYGSYLAAIGALTCLKFLCIGDTRGHSLSDEVWLVVKKLEALEHLRLCRTRTVWLWTHIGMLKSLKGLSIVNSRGSLPACTVPCEVLTGLECLDLNAEWNEPGWTTGVLQGVLQGVQMLTNLHRLGLSQSLHLTDEALLDVGELVRLKHLDLAGCCKITDAGVAHLTKLTALEVLNLRQCQSLTNGALVYVGGLGALRHLSLSTRDGTTHRPLALAQKLTALERFDLYGVDYVTDGNMAEAERLSFRMRVYLYDAAGTRVMKANV
ncbi:unnamed protein product [Ostreobium quekettii]|uniref:Uncharacterized protein n=1 Tax=Ostreobium quekettii TaxID=121088 RepID=A0A8S1JBT1_9CHLO|nr:unnamed protein product [Ostreobium quekettii]|eukprot:evm.model.scf_23.4 EVM.evm.TU.scf_23.4   scf_23:30247-32440(+)